MTYERQTDTEFTVTVRQRVTERVNDDEPEKDPTPSFPPMRVVVETDGETVNDWRPLAKCKAPVRARKVG